MVSQLAPTARLLVLVLEDDPLDAKLMEMSITATVACSIVVVNSRQGFEMELDRAIPSVIISDSNIPEFDGEAAFILAKERCPQVPFILYSGAEAHALEKKAAQLGAQGWLEKKDLDRLGDLVRKVCGLEN